MLSVTCMHDRIIAMAALATATFGILTAAPLFWSLPTAYLRGAAAAAGIAVINSCGNLAGFFSPYMIGWIKDLTGSTAVGMLYVATSLFTGAALVIAAIPKACVLPITEPPRLSREAPLLERMERWENKFNIHPKCVSERCDCFISRCMSIPRAGRR
jgi:hypothetical protein